MSEATISEFSNCLEQVLRAKIADNVVAPLWEHYRLLERWNRSLNLTSVKGLGDLVRRHYAESLLVAPIVSRGTLADIGSGAGFPGLPIAAARPDLQVTLVETVKKKAAFLREAADLFPNVTVISERAERLTTRFDVITARAVRPQTVLDLIPSVATAFVLLVGEADAQDILASKRYTCRPPLRIPWSERTVILSGHAVLA